MAKGLFSIVQFQFVMFPFELVETSEKWVVSFKHWVEELKDAVITEAKLIV